MKQAKRHNGTSCHQCKNIKTDNKLAFCSHLFDKRSKPEKRRCRKKYCSSCLQKFYNLKLENTQTGWSCMSCRGMCVCAACARKGFILSYDEREDQLSNPKPGMFMLPGQPNMYVQQLLMQQQAQHQMAGGIPQGDGYSDDSDDDDSGEEKASGVPNRMPTDPQMMQMKHPQAQQLFQNSQFAAELLANGVPAENIPEMLQQAYMEQQLRMAQQQQEMLGGPVQIPDPQQMYATMWPGGSLNPLPSGDEEKRKAAEGDDSNGSTPVPPEGAAKPAEEGERPPTQFRNPLDFARNPAEAPSHLQAAILARNFALLNYGQMPPGLHPPPGFRPPMPPPLEPDAMARVNIKNLVQKMRRVDNVKPSVNTLPQPGKSPPSSPSHSSGDDTASPAPKGSRSSSSSSTLEAVSPSKAKHTRSPSKLNNAQKAPKTLKAADAATAKKSSPPNSASFSPPPSPPLPALFSVTASSVDFTESTQSSFPSSSDSLPDHTVFDEPHSPSPQNAALAAKSAVALAQAAAAAEVSEGGPMRKSSQLGKGLSKRARESKAKGEEGK